MNPEVRRKEVEELQAELGRQLGYAPSLEDPILALAYTVKRIQEDQHLGMVEALTKVQHAARQLTAEGQKQITQFTVGLTDNLAEEMRGWINPETIAKRIVEESGTAMATTISKALQGHLVGQEERLRELVGELMNEHDERLLWNVHQRLGKHTQIHTRNTWAMAVLSALILMVGAAVFYRGSTLQAQVDEWVATTELPPPTSAPPAAALVAPRRGRHERQ